MGPKGLKAHMQSKTHPGILPERHEAEGSHASRKSGLFKASRSQGLEAHLLEGSGVRCHIGEARAESSHAVRKVKALSKVDRVRAASSLTKKRCLGSR